MKDKWRGRDLVKGGEGVTEQTVDNHEWRAQRARREGVILE